MTSRLLRASTLAMTASLTLPAVALAAPADPGGWAVDAGLISRVRPDHLGASRYTDDVLPILEIDYGDRLSFSVDDGLKIAAWRGGDWSAGPVVEYRQSYNDRLPRGAFAMKDAIEAGGFLKRRTPIGELDLRVRKAIDGYGGWSGDMAFDTGGQISPRWKVGLEGRLSWADSSFSREYFGLRRDVVRPQSLPRFGQNDFYSAGVELDAARAIGPRLSLVATLSADRIIGEEWESPLLSSRNVITAGVGLTYRFGRLAGPGAP
ncbi:MipA/OmpV family protein [Caulobacter sp. RL271]|uniref:MipA/OmpV family protein n=1 Tax=Caulobacter segnis TaxID=88688 RepID=A0ABY5A118_9CAUL|nr:MipA/OmpV family protein [Caulobacter segnis]USQ98455.1 MipA/OmpV family protein [Caulobacter segnis]